MTFNVLTNHPVAVNSVDHQKPLGAKGDNNFNVKFNKKVLKVIKSRPVYILDIGCAGGAMVRTFVEMGQVAIGIEGSNYNLIHRTNEWPHIPDYLFTADATKPFTVTNSSGRVKFDLVTAWEFWEHIETNDLAMVIKNIKRHLKPGGLMIGTINTKPSARPEYHRTVREPAFWIGLFEKKGFNYCTDLYNYFDPDWVRKCRGSFPLVMRLGDSNGQISQS